jgi:uncharacterized protein YbbK (DUF523 family)
MPALKEFLAKVGDAPVLVSACLLGLATRYDGGTAANDTLRAFAASHRVIPVCPEQLGGLATPRSKSFFSSGDGQAVLKGRAKVMSESGKDVTENFLRGAKQTTAVARLTGARFAVLKEKSPSCGVLKVYVNAELSDGCGVTAAVLKQLGIEIFVVM